MTAPAPTPPAPAPVVVQPTPPVAPVVPAAAPAPPVPQAAAVAPSPPAPAPVVQAAPPVAPVGAPAVATVAVPQAAAVTPAPPAPAPAAAPVVQMQQPAAAPAAASAVEHEEAEATPSPMATIPVKGRRSQGRRARTGTIVGAGASDDDDDFNPAAEEEDGDGNGNDNGYARRSVRATARPTYTYVHPPFLPSEIRRSQRSARPVVVRVKPLVSHAQWARCPVRSRCLCNVWEWDRCCRVVVETSSLRPVCWCVRVHGHYKPTRISAHPFYPLPLCAGLVAPRTSSTRIRVRASLRRLTLKHTHEPSPLHHRAMGTATASPVPPLSPPPSLFRLSTHAHAYAVCGRVAGHDTQ